MTKDRLFNKTAEIQQLRAKTEQYQSLAIQVLELLNQTDGKTDLIREILFLLKVATGFEAVGIRLKDGEDFPYYETIGFSKSFVKAERYLCSRDGNGYLIRDSEGNPYLECMCGNIIFGRTDPSRPFFSERGSFWTNSTSALLASTSAKDRQGRTRNRCNEEGYESVALIPLIFDKEIVGLLQLNDSRQNLFTEQMIHFFEGVVSSISIVLKFKKGEETMQKLDAINAAVVTFQDECLKHYQPLHPRMTSSVPALHHNKCNSRHFLLMEKARGKPDQGIRIDNPAHRLTRRECEVLKLIATGLSAGEIADKLYVSKHTVATHRTRIKQKLGIRKSTELVGFAIDNRLV